MINSTSTVHTPRLQGHAYPIAIMIFFFQLLGPSVWVLGIRVMLSALDAVHCQYLGYLLHKMGCVPLIF